MLGSQHFNGHATFLTEFRHRFLLLLQTLQKDLQDLDVVVTGNRLGEDLLTQQVILLVTGHVGRFLIPGIVAQEHHRSAQTDGLKDFVIPHHFGDSHL